MLKCPFCEAEIADESLRSGQCPRCGSRLAWEDDSSPAPVDEDPRESPDAPLSDSVLATLSGSPPIGTPTPPLPSGFLPATPPVGGGSAGKGPSRGGRAGEGPPIQRTLAAAFLSEPLPNLPTESQPTIVLPVEPASESGAPAGGELAGSEIGKTLSARELSPEDYRRMSQLWGADFAPPKTIQMTAKGEPTVVGRSDDTISGQSGSVLVIQSRSLRKVVDQESEGADYELLEIIGEGGVGVVYAARQASIDRTVAVKMLKADSVASVEQQEKFLSEAVVTGDLDHPNIVPIYDLGRNDAGSLFYSMKRVQGTPWLTVIRKKSLTENLDILMKVADAIAFAHARGVVHRDLKPENVMLGEYGEVLVMDWGIALATPTFRKSGSITQSLSMGGTPAYMSPEMVTGPVEKIGPCSDIYLLGALLYEIITGSPPHSGPDVMSCLYAAARNEIQPVPQSGELVDIAFRAMSTDPEQRYVSVQEFQKAIRDYQSHTESIGLSTRADEDLATAERTGDYQDYARSVFAYQEAYALWSGNSRALTGQAAAKLAYARQALSKGDYDLGLSLLDEQDASHRPVRKQLLAAQNERDARQQRLKSAKRLAAALIVITLGVVTFSYLRVKKTSDDLAVALEDVKRTADANEKLVKEQTSLLTEKDGLLVQKQAALDGEKKARDEAETARNEAVKAQRVALQAKEDQTYEAYLAQIGLAAEKVDDNAFEDARRLLDEYNESPLRHWEWSRLRYLVRQSTEVVALDGPVNSVAFAPDGRLFAAAGQDQKVRLFDSQSLQETRALIELGASVNGLAFSPDGGTLALACEDGTVELWSVADGTLRWSSDEHAGPVVHVTFSADGRWLLSSSLDFTSRLWDAASGELLADLRGHSWWVWGAAFSPDGRRIVSVGQDGKSIVWAVEVQNGRPTVRVEKTITTHEGPVFAVAFSPDGTQVATGGNDRRVLVWNPDEARPVDIEDRIKGLPDPAPRHIVLEGHDAPVRSLAFSHDEGSLRLASGSDDNTIRLWDVEDRQTIKVLRGHGGHVRSCVFSPPGAKQAGEFVLSGSDDRTVKLWDVGGYREYRVLKANRLRGHDGGVLSAAFDPQNRRVVTASEDRSACIWHLDSDRVDVLSSEFYKEGHEYLAFSGLFFDDGRKLLTSAFDNTARIWDVRTGSQLGWMERTGQRAVIAVSADGTRILTGSDDHSAKLWKTADVLRKRGSATPERVLTGHEALVTATAVSADGKWLFTGDASGHGILWSAENGDELRRLKFDEGMPAHARGITAAAFTADGRLLTASIDKTVAQWDPQTGQELPNSILGHVDSVTALAVSPDGRRALTVCSIPRDFETRTPQITLWDLHSARQLRTIDAGSDSITSVAFSPDGQFVAAACSDTKVRLWNLSTGEQVRGPDTQQAGGPYLDLSRRGVSVGAVAFRPDGQCLLTVGGNNARLWEVATGAEVMSFSPHRAVSSAHFSQPDGTYVVTGSRDSTAKIWSVAEQQVVVKLIGGHTLPVNAASFSPKNSQWVLTASDDRTAKLWEWRREGESATAAVLKTYGGADGGHRGRVLDAVFSPDGTRIVTVSSDRTARFWDVNNGDRPLHEPLQHDAEVLCAAFSADGRYLVTGCADWTARLWDARTGREIVLPNPLRGHTDSIASVAFSPDGRRILTGSEDGTAKIWDARKGKEILTLRGHSEGVTSVAFASDGPELLTGSRDGTAILWVGENVAPSVALTADALQYRRSDGIRVLDSQAEIFDPDSTRFDGGTLLVELLGDLQPGEQVVLQPGATEAGRIDVAGRDVTFTPAGTERPLTIGTLVEADPPAARLALTFSAQATHAAVRTLLRRLAYGTTSTDEPTGDARTIRFSMSDGDGGESVAEFAIEHLREQPADAAESQVADDVPNPTEPPDRNAAAASYPPPAARAHRG